MNNLEQIPLKQVTSPGGISYISFRKGLTPRFWIVWLDITFGYALLVLSMAAFIYIERVVAHPLVLAISVPFAGLFVAFWVAFLQLFIHEAAHHNIHRERQKNDILSNIFLGWFVGLDIEAYRHTHWKHHQNLGSTEDSENSYFNGLTLVFLIKMLTGLHALAILRNRQKPENGLPKGLRKKQRTMLVIGSLVHLLIVIVALYSGLYFSAAVWIAAIGVFYPFFATIRQVLEHRDEKADKRTNFFQVNHGKMSRLFRSGIFAHFFGGAGFSRHLLHHWDPAISYTRLGDLENFLETTDDCREIIRTSRTTYLATFLKLVK